MASKPKDDGGREAAADAVPPAVIAQAEAAIAGYFETESPPASRQTSRLSEPNRPAGAGEGSSR